MNPTDTPPVDLAGITHARETADVRAKRAGPALLTAVLRADPAALPADVRLAREALERAAWATAEADVRREDENTADRGTR